MSFSSIDPLDDGQANIDDENKFWDNYHSCTESAPGMVGNVYLSLFELIGGVLIVWLALALTPYAVQHKPMYSLMKKQAQQSGEAAEDDGDAGERGCCGCGPRKSGADRRGVLMNLLYWDVFAFAVSVILLAYWTTHPEIRGDIKSTDLTGWLFQSSLFWANIIYALLSFPFFPFTLPLLNKALTHAERTGYNANGTCVPFELAKESPSAKVAPGGAPAAADVRRDEESAAAGRDEEFETDLGLVTDVEADMGPTIRTIAEPREECASKEA